MLNTFVDIFPIVNGYRRQIFLVVTSSAEALKQSPAISPKSFLPTATKSKAQFAPCPRPITYANCLLANLCNWSKSRTLPTQTYRKPCVGFTWSFTAPLQLVCVCVLRYKLTSSRSIISRSMMLCETCFVYVYSAHLQLQSAYLIAA